MTPQQVEEVARNRFNAVNDNFFSQDEIFRIIYNGELELSQDALVFEARDTSITTVAGTRAYSLPTRFLAIKRIEYDGLKLEKTDFRDDDRLTLDNSATTTQGTPQYYQLFEDTIYLRPIPDAAETLTIYGYKEPVLLTTASVTLSVPTRFHMDLVTYVSIFMAAKDKDYDGVQLYQNLWEQAKARARAWQRKRQRTDSFSAVKDEESLGQTIIGTV